MGISSSKTVLNQITNTMTDVATTSTNTCSALVSGINTVNCPNLKADSLNINQGNSAALNFSCLQSNFTNTDIQQNMEDKISQDVEAAIGTFGVGISDTSAYTNYARNVATNIVTVSSNTCLSNVVQGNIVDCTGADVKVVNISQNNLANSLSSCVQSNTTQNQVVQNFVTAIEQSARSKVAGITGLVVLVVIVLVVGFGAYMMFKSGGGVTSDGTKRSAGKWIAITVVIILLLVGGWLFTAYFLKWWPFSKNEFEAAKGTS